jgi:hypothetical protein
MNNDKLSEAARAMAALSHKKRWGGMTKEQRSAEFKRCRWGKSDKLKRGLTLLKENAEHKHGDDNEKSQ